VRKTCARLVLRLARWRTVGEVPSSGVLVGAPHTSNWDWVAMLLLMWSGGVPPRVLIKAEVMRTPLGPLLRANGGISLDRENPGAVVRELLSEAKTGEPFLLSSPLRAPARSVSTGSLASIGSPSRPACR